ncbi:MAG TPA: hypothetical protein P5061_15375, partial [Mycobacterium sp.]|nr:hypothetical protein [Mycobacterium sp.]
PFTPEGDDISAQIEAHRHLLPMFEHMVTMDPPDHTKARSLLNRLLTPRRAEVASYFTVFTEIGLDHHGRYRDVFTPVGDEWLIAHRLAATDWSAPNSTMVG